MTAGTARLLAGGSLGFDPAEPGYGTSLQGMADRLHAIGGTLDVDSAPSAGTTVTGKMAVTREVVAPS